MKRIGAILLLCSLVSTQGVQGKSKKIQKKTLQQRKLKQKKKKKHKKKSNRNQRTPAQNKPDDTQNLFSLDYINNLINKHVQGWWTNASKIAHKAKEACFNKTLLIKTILYLTSYVLTPATLKLFGQLHFDNPEDLNLLYDTVDLASLYSYVSEYETSDAFGYRAFSMIGGRQIAESIIENIGVFNLGNAVATLSKILPAIIEALLNKGFDVCILN